MLLKWNFWDYCCVLFPSVSKCLHQSLMMLKKKINYAFSYKISNFTLRELQSLIGSLIFFVYGCGIRQGFYQAHVVSDNHVNSQTMAQSLSKEGCY